MTAILFVATWSHFSNIGVNMTAVYLVIVAVLIVMFVSDLKYQIISDELQMVLFFASLYLLYLQWNAGSLDLIERFVHAFVVMTPLLLLFLLTKGRGMGFADVKLIFILGLIFGLKLGLLIIYMAFISGGVIGTYLLITKHKGLKSKVAFGPFIISSALLVLYNQELFHKLLGIVLP